MKVAGQLGKCIGLYIAARVLIAILASFVPPQIAGIFVRAADFLIVCAAIVGILSMLLGGQFDFMRRIKKAVSSLAVFGILIVVALSYFGGKIPMPSPVNPLPVAPTNSPNPNPTTAPAPTAKPTDPPRPQPGPAPTPKHPEMNVFLMSEDNYNFSNSKGSFGYGNNYSIPIERFRQIFTPVMADSLYPLYSPWGGSCFGFSATSSLFNRGSLNPAEYQTGANMTYSLGTPKKNRVLLEFMELYQISQSLTVVSKAERANQMNYDGLIAAMYNADGSVNKRGLLVAVIKPTVGHAVIAYDIQNAGGGVYYLSIYDNNYPDDKNRKMRVDTQSKTWKYDSYGASDHYFRYLNTSVVYSAVQTALNDPTTNGEGGNMNIIIPSEGAEIFIDGTPISEIGEAFDATPLTGETGVCRMWHTYKAVYDVYVKGGDEMQVTFVDDDTAIKVNVGKTDAVIAATTQNEGFVLVDMDGALNVTLSRNDESPVTVSGKSAERFTLNIVDGKLLLTGDGKFMVKQGFKQSSVCLQRGLETLVDPAALKSVLPMYVFAGVMAIVILAAVIGFAVRKKRR